MIDRRGPIPVADILVDRFQVRKANTGDKIEDLAASIDMFGLLHPIVVCKSERDPEKWEVVAGQRRLLAHKKLGRDEIEAGIYDQVLSLDEGLAISGTENINQLDMTRSDLIDLCEQLFLRYGTIKAVWEKTRMPYEVVRKYVRYSRLEPTIKTMVDDSGLSVDLAIKAQDAATIDGAFQPKRASELIDVLRESDDELRKKILEVNESNPTTDIEKVVAEARKPDERLKVSFTMGAVTGNALRKLSEKEGGEPDTVAQDLVESGLEKLGLMND